MCYRQPRAIVQSTYALGRVGLGPVPVRETVLETVLELELEPVPVLETVLETVLELVLEPVLEPVPVRHSP